jgi:hypothetical protein
VELAQIVGGRDVRRSLEEDRQAAHRADVACLGSRLQLAHAHIVEHALTSDHG